MRQIDGAFVIAFVCLGTLQVTGVVAQEPVAFTANFTANGFPTQVNFKAWLPPDLDHVRGVFYSIPGHSGNTTNITTNGSWRGKITGMGFAIIGNEFTALSSEGSAYWGYDNEEIAANMEIMLSDMADALGHPEINNAPLLIKGVSHGGFATVDIANAIPERVLAFVGDKGTSPITGDPSKFPAVTQVPGLMVLGETDDAVFPSEVNEFFESWRWQYGQVAQEVDWTGHQNTNPDTTFAFLDQALSLRYPQGQLPSLVPGNPLPLVPLSHSSGWVGEVNPVDPFIEYVEPIEWPTITPANQFGGDPPERSWLPNETMAMVYRAHNAVPVGISRTALGFEVANDMDRNVNGGVPIDLAISLSEIAYDSIDVYHEGELIAELGYSSDPQHVFYTPEETGIHTFIAIAEYQYNGQTHYTSKYTTVGVAFISDHIPGDYNGDGRVGAADFTVWRDTLGSEGLGLAADGTGPFGAPEGIVNELDFEFWKLHYGEADDGGAGVGVSGSASNAVPEPTSLVTLLIGIAVAGLLRVRV